MGICICCPRLTVCWPWAIPAATKASHSMVDQVLEPLQYPFMVRGLLAAVMVGIVSATVGAYVVLRGMAFFGDALAHAILPGVAVVDEDDLALRPEQGGAAMLHLLGIRGGALGLSPPEVVGLKERSVIPCHA